MRRCRVWRTLFEGGSRSCGGRGTAVRRCPRWLARRRRGQLCAALRGELITRGSVAAARCLAACAQFRACAVCPWGDAELVEGFKRGAQVSASICPASRAAQPLAVQELCSRAVERGQRIEQADRLGEPVLSVGLVGKRLAAREQRSAGRVREASTMSRSVPGVRPSLRGAGRGRRPPWRRHAVHEHRIGLRADEGDAGQQPIKRFRRAPPPECEDAERPVCPGGYRWGGAGRQLPSSFMCAWASSSLPRTAST